MLAPERCQAANLAPRRIGDVVAVEVVVPECCSRRANNDAAGRSNRRWPIGSGFRLPGTAAVASFRWSRVPLDSHRARSRNFRFPIRGPAHESGVLLDGDVGVGVDIARIQLSPLGDGLVAELLDGRPRSHSQNAPLGDFWMLPLGTRVTVLRPCRERPGCV